MQDNRGMVADSVDITLDDSDNILEIPSMGVELELWLGWSDTGLIYKGKFLVTGCSHSGAPDTLHIAAEANDLAEAFRQKHERSFHKKVHCHTGSLEILTCHSQTYNRVLTKTDH